MAPNKESIEINCVACNTRFRLWVPFNMLREWEMGVRINCIKCGAEYFVRKGLDGFDISQLKELTAEKRPEPAAPAGPAAPAPRPAPKAPPAAQAVKTVVKTATPPPPPAAKAPVKPPAPKIEMPRMEEPPQTEEAVTEAADTVLVVEDDRLSRQMVEGSVKGLGFRLVSVKNATEAIRVLRKERISLIVTDLYLKNPGDPESILDGEELLKKVGDSGLSIPAIITTGKDIIDDLVLDPKWFDLNVKGFIQKGNPFWAEELKLKVKELLYKD
jgi:CheY-like chemotaxis protein